MTAQPGLAIRSRIWACTLLAGLFLLCGCKDKHDKPAPVRPVLSIVVASPVPRTATFSGTVQARYSLELGFRIGGRMTSRQVEVGDQVSAGQVLATLDPVSLALSVKSALGDVLTDDAQLATAANAERRQRILRHDGVNSQSQLDSARLARQTATATLQRAETNLLKAREQLGYANLTSGVAGVVTNVDAQVGQVVTAGQAIVTVAIPGIREAVVDVPEDIAHALKAGTAFDVSPQMAPAIHENGLVREVAPQADTATRSHRVRITLAKASDAFRLGTTIRAAMTIPAQPQIVLPRAALFERNGQTMVWTVDPVSQTVNARAVQVAGQDGSIVHLNAGLELGVRVVTAGANELTDGQKVSTATESATP